MKKIGFIDYYISEWHANSYPAWIKEKAAELGVDFEVAYTWAELDVSVVDGVTTDQWCERFGAKRCDSIEELCGLSDYIVILAPGFPEKHYEYASTALKYGKPTYIDKTFAQTEAEARAIYDLSKKYNTPIFSSSALRYADELSAFRGQRQISVSGGGSNIGEYIVHQAEMVEAILGVGVSSVAAEEREGGTLFTLAYEDDRKGRMFYSPSSDFTVSSGEGCVTVRSDFFRALIGDMLGFFLDGVPRVKENDTVEVIKIRELALVAQQKVTKR